MEAAPGSITREKVEAWRKAGINRVSLGVQSFLAKELSRTGRKHTAETVLEDVGMLRNAGIANINLDLIAGLPFQTRESWNESLDWIERIGAPHVSVYMLEVDDDSNLGRELLVLGSRYGAGAVPCDDDIAEFYETAVERLERIGIRRYEISNFARPGLESRHNLKYWRREQYLGFGADAHSFDGESRWQNQESAAEYVAQGRTARTTVPADTIAERFFLGLRLTEGIEGPFEPFSRVIGQALSDGLLERSGTKVRLTPRGVLLSNEVFQEFVGVLA
jgi:oxygen-independent coproporphyrinogen-3 oxidase